jgi:hypothetical protein
VPMVIVHIELQNFFAHSLSGVRHVHTDHHTSIGGEGIRAEAHVVVGKAGI